MRAGLLATLLLAGIAVFGQETPILLKEAVNLERTLKEEQALDKYRQVLVSEPTHLTALIRCSELSAAIGTRQADKNVKAKFYNDARDYADRALAINSNSVEANYVRAVVAGKLTETETENKKVVAHLKDTYVYAGKALQINPDYGKANYILGKWNYEVVILSWAKKAAVKVIFGGVPAASMDSAYKYMEICRKLEPYFVPNFLDLAKAYKYDHKPSNAIEILNQLVKLPTRSFNDIAMKAEGKQILSEMQ